MNCCWLLILLYLFGGNGCGMGICGGNGGGNSCGNGCSNSNRNDCDCGCDNERPPRPPKFPSCGCEEERIQPFSGFANMGTCGCEEKNDNDNDCER